MESLNDTLDRYSSPRNMLVTFNLLPSSHVPLFKISDRSVHWLTAKEAWPNTSIICRDTCSVVSSYSLTT